MNSPTPSTSPPALGVSAASAEPSAAAELHSLRLDPAHAAASTAAAAGNAAASAEASRAAADFTRQHVADDPLAENQELLAELAGREQQYSPEQLCHQAMQLASLLSTRQRRLDRRETELNAQTAMLEKELRSSRLWLRERQFELDQCASRQRQQDEEIKLRQQGLTAAHEAIDREMEARQAELEEFACQLRQRDERLAAKENDLQRRQAEFEMAHQVRQSQNLAQQRELAVERQRQEHRRLQSLRMFADMTRQLERRRAAIERRWVESEAALEASVLAGSAELERALEQVARRQQSLDDHAALLDEQHSDLQRQSAALEQSRHQLAEEAAQREQALTDERKQWLEGRREAELQLERRRESLDQRARSLRNLHDEVTAAHRESLELRLGVEQIWNQLAGKAAPAELTRRLGQFRAKLADQQREQREIAERRKTEILELAAGLQQQQATLRDKQQQLQRWLARRNEDLEEQAARLVAREQELDRQEQSFRQGQESWDVERRKFQQQVRRLQSQLRGETGREADVGGYATIG